MKTKYQEAYEAAQAAGLSADDCHDFATNPRTRKNVLLAIALDEIHDNDE